jgi:CHAT domain-containing protein/tetratricopeptide (TPR) repeat protein
MSCRGVDRKEEGVSDQERLARTLPPEMKDDLRTAWEAEQLYRRSGDPADLDSAAAARSRILEHAAFSSAPADFRLAVLNDAGDVFLDRYQARGCLDDLNRALDLWEQVVKATPLSSPNLPGCFNNLGICLNARFQRTGREADLEEAIRVYRQAVQATPSDSPDLLSILNSLGVSLSYRFQRTGRGPDLEEAIGAFQQAVRATPPDSPDLAGRLTNLGLGLEDRFVQTGRQADLEEAIRLYRQSVQATLPDSPHLPSRLTNLGTGLRARFGRTGQEADLEGAIGFLQQAVEMTPPDSPDLPSRLTNLGAGLRDRVARTGQEADMEEAIRVDRQAVQATPQDSPDLPVMLNNLGNGLRARFARKGQEADMEEAIRVYRQSVHSTPQDSPDLPRHLNNLGNGLRARFGRTGQGADLEGAIQVYRRACELASLSDPQVVLGAARNWGRWALQRRQWGETAEAYGYGLASGRQLLARQLHRAHKENWLRDLQEMSAPITYALAKLARYQDAATVIERGRARFLAEALQRHRRDLEQLPARGHEELYRRYHEIVKTQERLTQPDQPDSLSGPARLDAIVAANIAFDRVVADVQQVPGYADFLAEPTFAQIQAGAADTLLTYLLATAAGGLALLVDHGHVQPVWLDALTDAAVLEWLQGPANDPAMGGWLGSYRNWLVERNPQAQRAWFAAIDDVSHRVWAHIMEPLSAALLQRLPAEPSDAPGVTLIPCGLLALLPLHAAWTEDPSAPTRRRYFIDEFTVNYAPSALALGHARGAAQRSPASRLLAVEEPLAARASSLPSVHAEVAAIAGLFDSPVILARVEATRRAVLAALPQAQVVHFSCHGGNNWQSPLESGLLMADDENGKDVLLSVRDFLESSETGGRLATLSACETGIIGTDLPDEVVALPSALLQAGFGGVAASLWSVADISTAMLMEHFYRCWREEKLPPAQALRAAQQWLRNTTNREKAEYFKRYSPELSGKRVPEGVAVDFFAQVMSRDPESRDLAHPFWWAAFYLTGV